MARDSMGSRTAHLSAICIKNKMRMLAEVSQTSGLQIWKTFRDFLFAGLENVAACYIQYVVIQHQRKGMLWLRT